VSDSGCRGLSCWGTAGSWCEESVGHTQDCGGRQLPLKEVLAPQFYAPKGAWGDCPLIKKTNLQAAETWVDGVTTPIVQVMLRSAGPVRPSHQGKVSFGAFVIQKKKKSIRPWRCLRGPWDVSGTLLDRFDLPGDNHHEEWRR